MEKPVAALHIRGAVAGAIGLVAGAGQFPAVLQPHGKAVLLCFCRFNIKESDRIIHNREGFTVFHRYDPNFLVQHPVHFILQGEPGNRPDRVCQFFVAVNINWRQGQIL